MRDFQRPRLLKPSRSSLDRFQGSLDSSPRGAGSSLGMTLEVRPQRIAKGEGRRAKRMTTTRPAHDAASQAERLFEGFENLMPFRVNDILLVSSLYDSFILREDGRLNELLIGESLELDIHQVPGVTHVSTGT